MIEKIFLTSIAVFLVALLVINVMPDGDKLPTWFMAPVLIIFFGSVVVGFISMLFLIWA